MSVGAPSCGPVEPLSELARTVRLARDDWFQTIRLDRHACRLVFRTRAAGVCGRALVLSGGAPLTVLGAGRIAFTAVDALSLSQRGPRAYPAVHLTLLDRLVVVALLHDHELEHKAALMDGAERTSMRFGRRRALRGPGGGDQQLPDNGGVELVALERLESPGHADDGPVTVTGGAPVVLAAIVGDRMLAVQRGAGLTEVDGGLAELLQDALAGKRSASLDDYVGLLSDQLRQSVTPTAPTASAAQTVPHQPRSHA